MRTGSARAPETADEESRRAHERRRVMTAGVLLIDTTTGLNTLNVVVLDLSEGGAALRAKSPLYRGDVGRLQLKGLRHSAWFPIEVRWAQRDNCGWTAGVALDRPTAEKQLLIRQL